MSLFLTVINRKIAGCKAEYVVEAGIWGLLGITRGQHVSLFMVC